MSAAKKSSVQDERSTLAVAHPNIALVKYWGKASDNEGVEGVNGAGAGAAAGNVPAVPSLSITLDELETRTRLTLCPGLEHDEVKLNGRLLTPQRKELQRVVSCLDALREQAQSVARFRVETENNFPTGAGLASSASGFAALVVAADELLETQLGAARLSGYARAASASAARSLFGGFAGLDPRSSSEAMAIQDADYWPLSVVIAICDDGEKETGSTEGMRFSAQTSPFYATWVEQAGADYDAAEKIVAQRDFEQLAQVTESSTLKMHAVMLTTSPTLLYWRGATVECMHAIVRLRKQGTGVFYTMDAGPQVKAVCLPQDAAKIASELAAIEGVKSVRQVGLGGPARCLAVASEARQTT